MTLTDHELNLWAARFMGWNEVPTAGANPRFMEFVAAAQEAVRPYEIDGWRGRWTDLFNGHNRVTGNTFRVSFTRYVPRPEVAE